MTMTMTIEKILISAVELGASDVILTVGIRPHARVKGELLPMKEYPEVTQAFTREALQFLRHNNEIIGLLQDLDFSYTSTGLARFRVNAFSQRGSIGLVIRVVPHVVPSIDSLRLPAQLKDITALTRGLVLVSGGAGSGRSTTLAALINECNDNRTLHIISLEHPIEYLHKHKSSIINQREVGSDVSSFLDGLRSCQREDVDVVMLSEFKDREVIVTALELVEMGHIVLASCDGISAVTTLERIVTKFSQEQQASICMRLSNALEAIISQQLIVRKGKDGQIAAVEILRTTDAVRTLIADKKFMQLESLIESGTKHGMQSFRVAIDNLYKRGLIDRETLEHQRLVYIKS
jgi:twitching motility protein PilT